MLDGLVDILMSVNAFGGCGWWNSLLDRLIDNPMNIKALNSQPDRLIDNPMNIKALNSQPDRLVDNPMNIKAFG